MFSCQFLKRLVKSDLMQPGIAISYISAQSNAAVTILYYSQTFTASTHDLAKFSILGYNAADISNIEYVSKQCKFIYIAIILRFKTLSKVWLYFNLEVYVSERYTDSTSLAYGPFLRFFVISQKDHSKLWQKNLIK